MANLVVNGDFDNPDINDISPWTSIGAVGKSTYFNTPPYGLFINVTPGAPSPASVTQTSIPTTPGLSYVLSFYASAWNGPNDLTVTINGVDYPFGVLTNMDYEQFFINFTVDLSTPTTTLTFTTTGIEVLDLDTVSITAALVPCYLGDSMIWTKNIITGKYAYVAVKNITRDKYLVYDVRNNTFVPIIHNVKTANTKQCFLIQKYSLGRNMPDADFYITSGHIIYIDDEPVKARNIKNAIRTKIPLQPVYSIVVENGGPILVNNLHVMAYSIEKWTLYAQKNNIQWTENK